MALIPLKRIGEWRAPRETSPDSGPKDEVEEKGVLGQKLSHAQRHDGVRTAPECGVVHSC